MLLLDAYLDFLVSFKDTSIPGKIRRIYDYMMFTRLTPNELVEVYQWDVYRMLNDFVYLYSRLDLFFKLSTYNEFTEDLFLDMKRVNIDSEAYMLKDYTTYYTLKSVSNACVFTWNDKDKEVTDEGWGHRYWSPTSRHDGLVIDAAYSIVGYMNHVLRKFWFTPEKDLNYSSIYIYSLDILEFRTVKTSFTTPIKDFRLDLNNQCQYLHINDHKFKEIIPVVVQINYNGFLYIATVKLGVTYINYRIEPVKTTYNPYVVDYIQERQSQIVAMIYNIIEGIDKVIQT